MQFLQKLFQILEFQMPTPKLFGWYHILWLLLTVAVTWLLCFLYKKGKIQKPERVVWIVAVIVAVLEVYKQVIMCCGFDEWGLFHYEYQWYILPWQFCSMPLYVGLLAGILRGKARNYMHCFLATYAIFGGLTVMVYPAQVFNSTAGLVVQSMICHASMIVVGVFLFYTGLVKTEFKSLFKGSVIFVSSLAVALGINEWAYRAGIMEGQHRVNMFYVSPYCEPSLPVYSIVQAHVPFPWCLLIYIAGFVAVACIILLVAMLCKKLAARKKVA